MSREERFGYRLSLALGWPHPDFLMEVLSHEQYLGWLRYYGCEPFGFEVDDVRHGRGCAAVFQAQGVKAEARDFMLGEVEEVSLLDKFRAAIGDGPKED